jgi:lysine 6-dehydrogenase
MNIVVLGGAGLMGRYAVRDLVQNPEVDQVTIADLDVDLARQVAAILDSPKIKVQPADASDPASLVSLLSSADSLLNATVYYFNLPVMEACLEAGVHYVDMGGLFYTTRKQLELHQRFQTAGITAFPMSSRITPPSGWTPLKPSTSTTASGLRPATTSSSGMPFPPSSTN